MKQLEEFDPSPIDAIEFNVRSIKKYTSFFTIFLSIAVIALSFIINQQSLSEIYCPRKDLEVSSLKMKDINLNFSDSLICVVYLQSEAVSSTLSLSYLSDQGVLQSKPIPKIGTIDNFTSMVNAIGGNSYNCFNLKGIRLRRNDRLKIVTDLTPHTKVLVSCHSISSILNQKQQQILQISNDKFALDYMTYAYFSTNAFILQQRLFINYDPQIVYTLENKMLASDIIFNAVPKTEIYFLFTENYNRFKEDYLGIQFTIVRKNIAQIIGNLLAWRGLILIPISIVLIIFPIVEKYYKFELVKARYDSQAISTTNFGFVTDIKRRLSGLFPCFKKQKLLNKALQKIDSQLDIIHILQLQSIMRRQRSQFNQIEREEDIFDCKIEEKDIKMDELLQNYKEEAQGSKVSIAVNHKQIVFAENEQKDRNPVLQTIKSFIYSFDDSETGINISTNQGKGYGSVWSLFSFILLSGSICFILVFLGTFSLDDSDALYNAYAVDEEHLLLDLPSYSLAFRNSHFMATGSFSADIVDKNDNVVKSVSLVNDNKCNEIVASYGYQDLDWVCLAEDTQISNIQGSKTRLRITPSYTPPLPSFLLTGLAAVNTLVITKSAQGEIIPQKMQQTYNEVHKLIELKKIIKNNNGDKTYSFELKSIVQVTGAEYAIYINFSHDYTLAQHQDGSYWDLFDSAWGIVILASEFFLFRVGRLINSKILSSKLNTEKQEKRSDILTVLFDIDRLSKGIYKEELQSVGFYFKHKLPNEHLS